jgi:hypothetical protein
LISKETPFLAPTTSGRKDKNSTVPTGNKKSQTLLNQARKRRREKIKVHRKRENVKLKPSNLKHAGTRSIIFS